MTRTPNCRPPAGIRKARARLSERFNAGGRPWPKSRRQAGDGDEARRFPRSGSCHRVWVWRHPTASPILSSNRPERHNETTKAIDMRFGGYVTRVILPSVRFGGNLFCENRLIAVGIRQVL
jgi:hypothetical protein